jgi:flagellar biosynthesis GTPase FlhF
MILKLQDQMTEQEELIASARRERDLAQQESQRQQALSEASMNEVKEVLQALEELAMNYDQKTQEVLTKDKENEALVEDLSKKTVIIEQNCRLIEGGVTASSYRYESCYTYSCINKLPILNHHWAITNLMYHHCTITG